MSRFIENVLLGGYSSEVPPLPIPNREVKLTNADGTAYLGGRVGSRLFKVRQHCLTFFCARMERASCERAGTGVDVAVRK